MKSLTFMIALGLLNSCSAAAIDIDSNGITRGPDITAETGRAPCIKGTKKIISTTIVDGEPLVYSICSVAVISERASETDEIVKRQAQQPKYVCDSTAHVDANCGSFYGDRPDPHDCSTIARQIKALGNITLAAGEQPHWTYKTCETGLQNYRNDTVTLCTDKHNLSGLINYMAWTCKGNGTNGPITGAQSYYLTYRPVWAYYGAPFPDN